LDDDIPRPQGLTWAAQAHDIDENTYIADSTISDVKLGIDAGFGLFANRDFLPNSPVVDDDLITYYEGTILTEEELERAKNDPTYDKETGFIIEYQGLYIDGWDHVHNTYASKGVVINDFLDGRNNSYFSKERLGIAIVDDDDYHIKAKSQRKGSGTTKSRICLAIRAEATAAVFSHQEFGIPYGEHHFCKETIHIEVLFKAARYYWKNIMGDHKRRERWSRLPQARYLFNSPYHGAAPQTSVERVRKIIHHITGCGTGRCSCNIQELHEEGWTGNRAVEVIPSLSPGSLSKPRMSSTDPSKQQECIITKVVKGARVLRQETFKTPAVRPFVNTTVDILSFHEDTSDWGQLDAKCSTEHDVSHHIDESDPTSYSLLTAELQDLRSGMIGCEVVHRYFSILCPSSVNVNVQHLHPAFTSLMAGLVTDSGVDIHEVFEDRHLLCDWLLCPLVHDTHISFVTVIYGTCTMIHEDSLCGIHNSKRIFQGMAKFFRQHIAWRQERNRSLRNGLTRVTRWHTIEATPTTTAQQGDGISCGILMCGNATCRVQGMPGFSCGQSYVPQLRLHIYHCIMRSTLFLLRSLPRPLKQWNVLQEQRLGMSTTRPSTQ
jgi:hypothetical protein